MHLMSHHLMHSAPYRYSYCLRFLVKPGPNLGSEAFLRVINATEA
jgi:hypothetical protein